MPESPKILLIGNGPHLNRGCEAILRGSQRILKNAFGENLHLEDGSIISITAAQRQNREDAADDVHHFPVFKERYTPSWFARNLENCCKVNLPGSFSALDKATQGCLCALEIGGDNYSLDYGRPTRFLSIDRHLMRKGVPVCIWGASVGPFEKDAAFLPKIKAHLHKLKAIFVRESLSAEYLKKLGIEENVHMTADPAFLMEPDMDFAVRHNDFDGCIGLNLSPLMARYVHPHARAKWLETATRIVDTVLEEQNRPVVLISHVTTDNEDPWSDDFVFQKQIFDNLTSVHKSKLKLAPDNLTARQVKGLISRLALLAAARTHATIAGFSTCVPTISFAYSTKAYGLNRLVYGSESLCIPPKDLSPQSVLEHIRQAMFENDALRANLSERLPSIQANAMQSGFVLRKLLGY